MFSCKQRFFTTKVVSVERYLFDNEISFRGKVFLEKSFGNKRKILLEGMGLYFSDQTVSWKMISNEILLGTIITGHKIIRNPFL